MSIQNQEPVLLIGETGTGKTTTVQYLAQQTGHKLIVINMNQQSDSTDLLGGFKPVDLRFVVGPVREEFEELFNRTFSKTQNTKFLGHIMTCFCNQRWSDLFKLMSHSQQSALKRCENDPSHLSLLVRWQALGFRLQQLRAQIRHAENALAFTFVEGSLVKALKNGDWVLLDEINLAAAETLECLSGLLEGSSSSLYLLERGDREPVKRHPDFRLFACMNPATDVGKKELPPGIRNRFTEFYVEELISEPDLKIMVGDYLRELSLSSTQIEGIVKFYLQIRSEATKTLTDGTGRQPHYSLRTLCRALAVAAKHNYGSVPRSLYEGFCLGFLTQLDRSSHPRVEELVVKNVLGKRNVKSVMTQEIPKPSEGRWIQIEGYWLPQGDEEPKIDDKYIMTESVRLNLRDLVRVVSGGKHPVLLQGETSVGKTSLIKYLAQATGNRCLRVNNHEHTDLQEYVGSYTADSTGKLVFKEGVLIEAMRKGYWIIFDELNLAPSDVLEALNRVLDENRELFIPETQETVQAHPRFLLFATQNPAGLYGGRKVLSRAFRNRFIELHFDQIPSTELETILHLRCDMPMSYCKRLVAVLKDLQLRRRGSAAFAGKQGFITLRDLFRWAERYRLAPPPTTKFYDWDQHLADEGYLLLAGRVRRADEAQVIREVLEKHLKRRVDEQKLFTLSADTSPVTRPILERVLSSTPAGFEHLVWTFNMRRLAVLVGQAFLFREPVLLVGETGCGKTTVCQLLAQQAARRLFAVNCHQYSEGSDFLGGLRPARDHDEEAEHRKLFEWVDGPLVMAMKGGHVFLADEISLADDSVLERLNSVLEPERTLLLAEKGAESMEPDVITAQDGFRFIGTMNPGGDYGKKELSPALRNRFTEIWCPITSDAKDMVSIIEHNLRRGISLTPRQTHPDTNGMGIGSAMMGFVDWFSKTDLGKRTTISIRDILAWVSFINRCTTKPSIITTTDLEDIPLENGHQGLPVPLAYIHGACMVFLDALGTGVHATDSQHGPRSLRQSAIRFLAAQMESLARQKVDISPLLEGSTKSVVISHKNVFGIPTFLVAKGPLMATDGEMFTFQAPTTSINLIRVLRALQLNKPLLLEGSPGVGKTSLVAALAKAAGYELVRINLSEQTDVSDLFGADLPVEGGQGGHFAWRDGPLLQALKAGHWIVLDELNLASQSVLEGLNACLDHRGELYIPELGKTFYLQSQQTRLFACQNPLRQGGARKGLPRSFLNRFTQVFVEPLSSEDLEFITSSVFPQIPERILKRMVAFNSRLVREVQEEGRWGQRGGPWELNLRDMFRWCEAIVRSFERKNHPTYDNPGHFVQLIYVDRMRTLQDKQEVLKVYSEVFGEDNLLANSSLQVVLNSQTLYAGGACVARRSDGQSTARMNENLNVLQHCLAPLESLMRCVAMNWMAILVGTPGSGKSSLVHLLSQLTGHRLQVMTMNSAMDTTELLGGFEQADLNRRLEDVGRRTHNLLNVTLRRRLTNGKAICIDWLSNILDAWNAYIIRTQKIEARNIKEEVEHFMAVCQMLRQLLTVLSGGDSTLGGDLDEEGERLRTEVDALLELVTQQRAVNGGGRFEWVDSVLVQCLRQGHWLLIDNVNFCSPSVLDRLNALLEPNGVLVMSERGVATGDNRIPTIKPHPDFRLFLAMDPRHGEISRAMRNRGVEIYLPGPQDGTPSQGDYNTLDYRTLFNSVGFSDCALQNALLAFHRASLHATTGSTRPTFSDVFNAASTCVQYVSRYGNPALSLYQACQEVYVKACLHLASKTALQTLLTDHAHQWEQSLPTHSTSLLSATSSPSYAFETRNLFHSTQLAMVTQSACVIEALLRNQMLPLLATEEDGSSELDKFDYSDLANQVFHAVIRFYLESSYQDVPLRTKWLRTLLGSASTSANTGTRTPHEVSEQVQWNWIAPLGSKLQGGLQRLLSSLTEFPVILHKQWPWDLRWFPDIYAQEEEELAARGRGGAGTEELRRKSGYDKKAGTGEDASRCPDVESHCNRVALWLYYTAFQLREEQQWANHTMKKGQPLLYDYCHAVHHGTLAVESLPHRVFAHLAQFLNFLDECIAVTLSSPEFVIRNEELQDYWHSLYQRVLFAQVLREKVTKNNLERVLHWLGQHLRWLCKSRFYALLKQKDGDKTYLRQLELLMEGGHLHSIYANRFRKALEPPEAFCPSQRDQYVLEALKTAAAVDLIHLPENGTHPSPQKNLITLHASSLGQSVRQDLANLRNLDVVTAAEFEQRFENLKSLIARKPQDQAEEGFESGIDPLHIQLWPFWQQLVATVGLDRELGPPEKLHLPIDVSGILAQVSGMEFLARLWSYHNLLLRQPWTFVNYNPKEKSNEEITFNGRNGARAKTDDRFNQTAYIGTPVLSIATVHVLGYGEWQMGKPSVQPLGMHSEKKMQIHAVAQSLWRASDAIETEDCLLQDAELALQKWTELWVQTCHVFSDHVPEEILENQSQWDLFLTTLDPRYKSSASKAYHQARLVEKDIKMYRQGHIPAEVLRKNTAMLWIDLGLLQTLLLTPMGYIDPAQKYATKKVHSSQELKDVVRILQVYRTKAILTTGKVFSYQDDTRTHPFITFCDNYEKILRQNEDKYAKQEAYRPTPELYDSLVQDVAYYASNLGSGNTVESLHGKLVHCITKLQHVAEIEEEDIEMALINEASSVLKEVQSWQHSQFQFVQSVWEKYAWYPDIITPLLVASFEVAHGLNLLNHQLGSMLYALHHGLLQIDVTQVLADFVAIPSHKVARHGLLQATSLQNVTSLMVDRVLGPKKLSQANLLQKQLLLASLSEVCSVGIQQGQWSEDLGQKLREILFRIVHDWEESEKRKAKQEEEKESLYRVKEHKTENEEEENKEALREMFPSYTQFFADFEGPSLESGTSEAVTTMENEDEEEDKILPWKEEDMILIAQMHLELMKALSQHWNLPPRKSAAHVIDTHQTFLRKYQTMSAVLEEAWRSIESRFDGRALGAHLVACHLSTALPQQQTLDVNWDVYKDPCVQEAVLCRPILENLRSRVQELLLQWPGHATLVDMVKLIERIEGFDVTASLMQFVTGLELLLTKAQLWEDNAHKGVSIASHLQAISELILKWRKLELHSWKSCLNVVARKSREGAAKWWFHLFSSLRVYLADGNGETDKENDSESAPISDLHQTLQQFMESSTLGQFQARLDILRAFMTNLCQSKAPLSNEALEVVWNVCQFYSQFEEAVVKKIKNLRDPIEKEVKNFVKIMRWNDINFWAMKETVAKSHQTLHKHMRTFENVLKQSVKQVMTELKVEEGEDQEGVWDKKTVQKYEPHFGLYMAPNQSEVYGQLTIEDLQQTQILNRLPDLYPKARHICRDVVESLPFYTKTCVVNDFVGEIIITMKELQRQPSYPNDKDREKAESRALHARKRKLLAELFRLLQRMGLSYRKGAVLWKDATQFQKTHVPIIEIEGAVNFLPTIAPDTDLKQAWDSVPMYYNRCVARLALLATSLDTPSKELGPALIERCRGFSAVLMTLVQQQWRQTADLHQTLCQVRLKLAYVKNIVQETSDTSFPDQTLVSMQANLTFWLLRAESSLQQYELLIQSCPEERSPQSPFPILSTVNGGSLLNSAIKGDETWQRAENYVMRALSELRKLRERVCAQGLVQYASKPEILSWSTIASLQEHFKDLSPIMELLRSLRSMFQPNTQGSSVLSQIVEDYETLLSEFSGWETSKHREEELSIEVSRNAVEKVFEDLCGAAVFPMQELFKKYSKDDDKVTPSKGDKDEEEEGEDMEIDHLVQQIVESLQKDITSILRPSKFLHSVQNAWIVAHRVANQCPDESELTFKLLAWSYPLMEQYLNLATFYLTQQVFALRTSCKLLSVLLSIFTQLAQKGFCLPSELAEELNGSGGTQFEDIESGGLGEGEGSKDVSDKLESEDQLEGAKQAGQEDEKEQDKPVSEEENGIEMSDDFEGAMQDREKGEDDEDGSGAEDENDDELDKQMGDVDQNENKLDDEIWGDDEEEAGDNEDQREDEDNQGEGTGTREEPELAAKDNKKKSEAEGDDSENTENQDEAEDERKQPQINEMDEENYNDDQIDPYHDKQGPEPEPEAMDLPEDLNLDDGEQRNDAGEEEENLFDIDNQKEDAVPETQEEEDNANEVTENPEEQKDEENSEDADGSETKKKQQNGEENEEAMDEDGQNKEGEQDKPEATQDEEEHTPDNQEKATPSIDRPSTEEVQAALPESQRGTQDETRRQPTEEKPMGEDDNHAAQNVEEAENEEGIGQAEKEDNSGGHEGAQAAKVRREAGQEEEEDEERNQSERKPGQSDVKRSLADLDEINKRKIRPLETKSGEKEEDEDGVKKDEEKEAQRKSEVYEHIRQAEKDYDALTMDTATEEQAKERPVPNEEDEKAEEKCDDEQVELKTEEDEELPQEEVEKKEAEKRSKKKKKKQDGKGAEEDMALEENENPERMEIEGETVLTATAARGPEATFHTQDVGKDEEGGEREPTDWKDIDKLREELEQQLQTWTQNTASLEDEGQAQEAWLKYETVTTSLAMDLCEQLRLVLEPSQAAKLKGDYRTGKRLNMRKVIPYIASQFRKDKIWLRRTKPSKRQYQIALAIDDSSSMADSHSRQLAFESLALISKALTLLEAGELAIISFGEQVRLLHSFQEPFSDHSGARLLQQFSFDEKKTRIAQLVDYTTGLMLNSKGRLGGGAPDIAQLLVIVSDGRGLFNEGMEPVHQAIRRAKEANVFMVFVIVDNPENKDSILDIRMPVFGGPGQLLEIKSYMDQFPFPYYLILRDINSLPSVLSDALRQWFELVSSGTDH